MTQCLFSLKMFRRKIETQQQQNKQKFHRKDQTFMQRLLRPFLFAFHLHCEGLRFDICFTVT